MGIYGEPIKYFVWLILVLIGCVYRVCGAVVVRLYYLVARKNPFAELGPVQNVVFVGGFLSFVPGEMPFVHYWGALGSKVAWAPMIGPVSSMSDRACELFYAVFAHSKKSLISYRHEVCDCKVEHRSSKPLSSHVKWWVRLVTAIGRFFGHKDPDIIVKPVTVEESQSKGVCNALTFIAHSAGGGTVNAMIVMLAYHHKYLLDHGFDVGELPSSLELEKLSPDFARKAASPMFVDGDKPYVITPNSIKRVIYISSPLGGIEYARKGARMSDEGRFKRLRFGWWAALLTKLLDGLWGRTEGVIYDFFLEQFRSPLQFAEGCDHIGRDFIGPNQRELTDRALLVLKAYGIEEIRVVTQASVAVLRKHSATTAPSTLPPTVSSAPAMSAPAVSPAVSSAPAVMNLLRPGACLPLFVFALTGCGWACDEGESEQAAFGPNDGVVSVASQLYGHRGAQCGCTHFPGFPLRCSECGLWRIGVDHLEVVGTFGSTRRVRALYASLFKEIATLDEHNVLIF